MNIKYTITKMFYAAAVFAGLPLLLLGSFTGIWAPTNLYRLLVVRPLERRLESQEGDR